MSRERGMSTVWGDIACVSQRDPAARGMLEVLLLYPGVHALIFHRFAHRLWRAGFKFVGRFVSWFARLVTNIDIHPGATIGERVFIDHGAGVRVKRRSDCFESARSDIPRSRDNPKILG